MGNFDITIGATETGQVNTAETLSINGQWQDEAGNPLDLNGGAIEVLESSPASLAQEMLVTITDAASGGFSLFASAESMAKLNTGRRNWFRLRLTMSEYSKDTTPRIWIELS